MGERRYNFQTHLQNNLSTENEYNKKKVKYNAILYCLLSICKKFKTKTIIILKLNNNRAATCISASAL